MVNKILYSQWMKELDTEAINCIGIPSIVLMENASKGAADFFSSQFPLYPKSDYSNVIVFVGKGNNGGDGLAVGRILAQKGFQVEYILLTSPDLLPTDPKINFNIIKKIGLKYTVIESDNQLKKINEIFNQYNSKDTFIIDALFGTGLNKPLRPGIFKNVIQLINASSFSVGAIDIPSGLSDAFLPEEGIHITADMTATFQSLKVAHFYPDGNKYCGNLKVMDIGIPKSLMENKKYYIHLIDPTNFKDLFQPREVDSHKGTFGHSLTICGSREKPGAGILGSFAVLKSGAGLCTTAVTEENRTLPISVHPELMTCVYKSNTDLLSRLNEFNSILIGPGMGNNQQTADIVSLMIENAKVPIILDADALNIFEIDERKYLLKNKKHPIVITPHPGEFSRLCGISVKELNKDRIGLCRNFAQSNGIYVILKGHHTLIATPNGIVYFNPTGNPGMATAGSGDVLSGMITGMISQWYHKSKYTIEQILQAAVFIHGYSGDLATQKIGEISLTATDLINYIPMAIRYLNEYQTSFTFS